ncbi:MAG: glutamate--tRNA ligase, partial [Anaerolineae bacterium]|nr:glutamate--tRNA ligase [Anaerolineae bacterium]
KQIAPIIQVRMTTLDEAPELAGFFFRDEVSPEPADLIAKNMDAAASAEAARRALAVLQTLPDIAHDSAEEPLRMLADELGVKAGQLFGILRAAVTGQQVSPPLFESMEIIGRDTVISRIENAISALDKLAAQDS